VDRKPNAMPYCDGCSHALTREVKADQPTGEQVMR
jgi:hypothetical protein